MHGFSPPSLIRQPPGVWCECRPAAYGSELLHKSVLPREKPGYMWTPLTSRLGRTPFFSFSFFWGVLLVSSVLILDAVKGVKKKEASKTLGDM